MARIRTIKPEFWQDEKISTVPLEARLVFIGCWNIADDGGVLRGSAMFIKSQLFPYDETLRISEVKKWIDALVEARFLIPLTYKNESYLYIRTFNDHQKIDKASKSRNIPEITLNQMIAAIEPSFPELVGELSDTNRRVLVEYSRTEKEIVGSNTEEEGKGREYTRDEDLENSVLSFWGFNQIADHDKARQVFEFCSALFYSGRLELFRDQFTNYVQFKELNRGFPHAFKNFLGDQSEQFKNGAWNAENWRHMLEKEQQRHISREPAGKAETALSVGNTVSDYWQQRKNQGDERTTKV